MKNDVLREKIEECLKTLGARDLTKVHKFLTELMLTTDAPMKANLACPWCGSTQVIKYGLKNMRQRYRCQHESCKPLFPYYDYELGEGTPKAVRILRIAGLSSVCNIP